MLLFITLSASSFSIKIPHQTNPKSLVYQSTLILIQSTLILMKENILKKYLNSYVENMLKKIFFYRITRISLCNEIIPISFQSVFRGVSISLNGNTFVSFTDLIDGCFLPDHGFSSTPKYLSMVVL